MVLLERFKTEGELFILDIIKVVFAVIWRWEIYFCLSSDSGWIKADHILRVATITYIYYTYDSFGVSTITVLKEQPESHFHGNAV